MKFMGRAGEVMAKRPVLPLVVLIMITVASLGIIAVNPPSFDMDEEGFGIDNDVAHASEVISEAFTSTASIISMVNAANTADGNVFNKQVFINVLKFEKSLASMSFTDIHGVEVNYANLPMFRIVSPVSVISEATVMALIAGGAPIALPDPALFADKRDYYIAYYEVLIGAIGSPFVNDSMLQTVASMVLSDPSAGIIGALLTNDAKWGPGTASASGCMVTLVFANDALELIPNGQLGFERDMISVAGGLVVENADGLVIKVAGMRTIMSEIGDLAQNDISTLLPVAIIIMVVMLLLIYRDFSDAFVGLLGLLIAIIWTFGISTVLGIPMSTIAIAVPILIMALGIDYSLHIVFRYREERTAGNGPAEATGRTLASVGAALVLATLTTAIAFLSYLTSSMNALADFGVMCAIGIVCSFGAMLLLVPVVQVRRDMKALKKGKNPDEAKRYRKPKNENGDVLGRISGIGGRMAAKSPWAVLGVTALVVGGLGYSATNLSYAFDLYDFVPEGTEAYEVITYLTENYSSTTDTVSVLIYSDGWNYETIRAIEGSLNNMGTDRIDGLIYTGTGPPNSESIHTALFQFNQAFGSELVGPGETYSSWYEKAFGHDGRLLPTATQADLDNLKLRTPEIVVASFVGDYHGESVTRFILPITSEVAGNDKAVLVLRDNIDNACSPLTDAGIRFITTGSSIVMAVTMNEMNTNQMTSLLMTIVVVLIILTIVMYFYHRSLFLGAMATIPTLISVVMVWGTMALMNISMNVLTLTIASLTVGMGVTYGIHISHRYMGELRGSDISAREAIKKTTRETGKGVFAAALTTITGFGVFGLSNMVPFFQFGLITALAIGFSYLGAIFILPSMLTIWGERVKPKLDKKRVSQAEE